MTLGENTDQILNDDIEGLKTKLLATDTRLQLTATELKATQQELETAKKNYAYLDASLVASVTSFARPTPPDGWLLCDGEEVSRTNYARLFEAIGTIYGEGDGSTTFNLPDMRGLFVRGHDSSGKHDLKREFGSYQDDQIQSHSHSDSGHNHSGSTASSGSHAHSGSIGDSGSHAHSGSTNTEGYHSHSGRTDTDGSHNHYLVCGYKPDLFGDTMNTGFIYSHNLLNIVDARNRMPTDGSHSHTLSISSAGSHSHTLSISSADNHTHKLDIDSAGSHSHSVSINNGQANLSNPTNARHGSETRVKNIALIYCIKY
ncbi:MAG TPA: hypothetical protein DCQ51_21050 [Planktothrix sp. UBA8407]|jgi:Microcystin-dependent protein|nr:hypothetical protein [Planktothrix sp. UBA8407]